MKDSTQRLILILIGIGFFLIGLFFSPELVTIYFSPDGSLGTETLQRIFLIRLSLIIWGAFFWLIGFFKKFLIDFAESKYLSIHKVISILMFGSLVIFFFFYLIVVFNRIRYPSFCGDWIEKTIFVETVRIINGSSIYISPESAPIPTLYGFVYKAFSGLLMNIFGVQVLIPKIISTFASFATGVMIFVIVYGQTRKTFYGLISSLFYFSLYKMVAFSYDVGKTDSLCLFLIVIGVWLIQSSQKPHNVCFSALVLTLAFFTNQSAMFAIAAVFIFLIIKNKKQAVLFVLLTISSLGLGLLLLSKVTGGWYYFWTIVWPSRFPYNLIAGIKGMAFFSAPLFFVIALIIVFIFYSMKHRKKSSDRIIIWGIVTLCAFTFSAISYSKAGANYNVFMPVAIFLSILFGFSYHWLTESSDIDKRYLSLLFRSILIFQLVVMIYNPMKICAIEKEDIENFKYLQTYVSSSQGEIYLPLNQDISAMAGKDTYDEVPAIVDYLLVGFQFPERLMRKMLNSDFTEIIIPSGRDPFSTLWYEKITYPETFKKAFVKNYTVKEEKWGMVFYKRKDSPI